MVRKTHQKRKAKIKDTPTSSAKDSRKDDDELMDVSVQTNDNEKPTAKVEYDETSDYSNEKAKFSCAICDQSFKFKTGLKKHKLRHKPPGGFVCLECGERFVTDAERVLHKEDVHKIFKCMICNEKCSSENDFVEHINRLHNGRDREYVVCDDCGAQFRQKNQLKLHCKSRCGTVRSFECDQCDAKFMTQNTLNAHLMIHFGEKKHLCNFCGSSFLSRGQLKIHERCHTKEKPYKCLVCNKGFAHRESLVTHSSLHTGVKPYMCQCCGQKFSCVGNLIKHRRIRPQSCGLPKYTNTKCAPRASTKVPGSLTLKKEPNLKRNNTKRKIVTVPELLPERVELTKQSENIEIEPMQIYLDNSEIEQESTEIITDEPIEQHMMKNEVIEIGPQSTSGHIEILEQRIISSPLSYTIPKTSVLVLTTDGNYVITKLDDDVNKTDEIEISPPNVKEIIILNGNNMQLGMNYQPIQQTVDDNTRKIEIVHEATAIAASPFTNHHLKEEEEGEEDPMYDVTESQYNENVIQHLEIVPAVETHRTKKENTESTQPIKTVGNVKLLNCDVCSKHFKQEKSLINHMNTKHSIECDFINDFKCAYCHKQYSSRDKLNKHLKCHGTNGELCVKCSCCNVHFASKSKMHEHARKEHEERLRCNYCNRIFKQVDCKTAHIRKVHMKIATKKYTFVCSKCGKKFNSNMALLDHEKANCGEAPLYKCDHCEKSLHSLGSLKIHLLIHTGDLPWSCGFCKKRFRTQGQVKVHERSHSGEKPFKCTEPNCIKAFAHRESLLTHLTVHTGVKRFACQGCDSRFSCISNLKAHRRSHQETCGQLPLDTRAQYTFNLDDGTIMVPQKS